MHKGVVLALVLVLAGGVLWSARASDEAPLEERLADIERRLERIERHLFPKEAALAWTAVASVEDLRGRLAKAAADATPVVVAVWADWCTYSKRYRELIEKDPDVRSRFQRVVRLAIDTTESARDALRARIGVLRGQPQLAFFGADGQQVEDATITAWRKEQSKDVLMESLARILPE